MENLPKMLQFCKIFFWGREACPQICYWTVTHTPSLNLDSLHVKNEFY